ncbi:uncharacterized protein LOC144580244 isoform X1 [Callithrix jacchus]
MRACNPAPVVLWQPGQAQENLEPSDACPQLQPHLLARTWERLPGAGRPPRRRRAPNSFAGLAWSERSEATSVAAEGCGGPRWITDSGLESRFGIVDWGLAPGGSGRSQKLVAGVLRSHHLGEVPRVREPGAKAEQNLRSWAPYTRSTPLSGTESGTRNSGRSAGWLSGTTPRRWSCLAHRSGDLEARDKPHRVCVARPAGRDRLTPKRGARVLGVQ